MNKKLKIGLSIIIIIFIIIISFGIYYVNDYYHADSSVSNYLNGTKNVTVEKINNGLFLNSSGEDTAIIFIQEQK